VLQNGIDNFFLFEDEVRAALTSDIDQRLCEQLMDEWLTSASVAK